MLGVLQALAVSLVLSTPRGQVDSQLEQHCRALLDTPLMHSGDWQSTAEERLAWLRDRPEHPLAEAAMVLLREEIDQAADPAWVAERLLELGELPRASPALRRRFEITRARSPGVIEGHRSATADPFPHYLRQFWLLAPVEPRAHARGWSSESEFWFDPELSAQAAGSWKDTSEWVSARRPRWSQFFHPTRWSGETEGQVWLACLFDVAEGGAAWLEIESPGLGRWAGREFPGFVPGYGVSVNSSAPHFVHAEDGERSQLEHLPVVLRRGRNRILLRASLAPAAGLGFGLRVLNAAGDQPFPELVEVSSGGEEGRDPFAAPLGSEVSGAKPPPLSAKARFEGAIAYLSTQPVRGPAADALLAVLLRIDHRPVEGLDLLQRALERAPDEPWLAARTARAIQSAPHLPATWREARARELAQRVVAEQPTHLGMQMLLANIEAGEDREEEALARLQSLADELPETSRPLALQYEVLRRLGMQVRAEASLAEALRRAPNKPALIMAWSQHLDRTGRESAAAEALERTARAAGVDPDLMRDAAASYLALGHVDRGLDLLREAVDLAPEHEMALLRAMLDAELYDEVLERAGAAVTGSAVASQTARLRAEIAMRRGHREEEIKALKAVLRERPSQRPARMRLRELGVSDACSDFLEQQRLDVDALLADFDGEERDESVVSVLDHAIAWVFEDGATETITQNVQQARDLAACEQLGRLQLAGEVIEVATIDGQTGARSEPVLVGQEYVMPDLEPGDFVESTYRTIEAPTVDGVPRLGGWFFASIEKAFALSRYVLSLPEHSPLRRVQANCEQVTETSRIENGRQVLEFVARGMPRVVLEPATPAPPEFLPVVEFGADVGWSRIVAMLRSEARWSSLPNSSLKRLAEEVAAEADGQEAAAKALFAHVAEALDQRAWMPTSPMESLLARRGNPNFLYLALLRAMDIPAELVWTRGVTPASDPEPEARFQRLEYWRRVPLVRVRPRDGEVAWCDLSPEAQLLPYGRLIGQFSGARALLTETGEQAETPHIPFEQRPMHAFEGSFTLALDGSARLVGRHQARGGLGWLIKENVRKLPENEVRASLRALAAQLVPGLTLTDYELIGLENDLEPLVVSVEGQVRTFLDRSSDGWVTGLPILPLELSADFAGQGERRLPFRLPAPMLSFARVQLVLPPELELVGSPGSQGSPRGLELDCPGGSYRLTIAAQEDGSWFIEREVAIEVFDLPAEEFESFREFCARVDEAERVRLRFQER